MNNVIKDIINRTNKEMYIGVVGAVRTGKSTFIKKFMERKVLPFIDDSVIQNKIVDELPHSSQGKTIMTVEPKFIPNNAIKVSVDNELEVNVRLVDCVGYVINGASGHYNEDGPRMVKTPWFEDEISFIDAAELGTNKVIKNHSNIGIVVTTDGSVTDFSREDYIESENKVIEQMKSLDKPFVVVLNTINPNDKNAKRLANDLSEKHQVGVIPLNVENMSENDIDKVLRESLNYFDISELNIKIPSWLSVLDVDNEVRIYLDNAINDSTKEFKKMKDVYKIIDNLKTYDQFTAIKLDNIDVGIGSVDIIIECNSNLYQQVLDGIIGKDVNSKGKFIKLLQEYKTAKSEYDEIKIALDMVKKTGYGVSLPKVEDMHLEKPEIIKQSGRYGVKLKAIAPSIHMIKVDVESSFEPIIGTKEQSKDLIDNLFKDRDKKEVWSSEIFGRKLSEVVNDGIKSKLFLLPDKAKIKFKDTLEKVINVGTGGLIAIIL